MYTEDKGKYVETFSGSSYLPHPYNPTGEAGVVSQVLPGNGKLVVNTVKDNGGTT